MLHMQYSKKENAKTEERKLLSSFSFMYCMWAWHRKKWGKGYEWEWHSFGVAKSCLLLLLLLLLLLFLLVYKQHRHANTATTTRKNRQIRQSIYYVQYSMKAASIQMVKEIAEKLLGITSHCFYTSLAKSTLNNMPCLIRLGTYSISMFLLLLFLLFLLFHRTCLLLPA